MIDIPFKDHKLCIYSGKKGRVVFNNTVKLVTPEWKDDNKADGMTFQNHIFVEDKKNMSVLLHEVSHFLDNLYEEFSCETETEFKACLFAYIMLEVLKVLKWV